jgi:hypothetical protein
MAEGHGWGGASRADSNHPALTSASAPLLIQGGELFLVLMSPCYRMCIPLAMARRLTLYLQRQSQTPL